MDVLMPQLGETVAEGKISKWFVAAGDAVKPGDNLFEIETDKVSMEVPAISAGTLAAIHVQAGEIAPVGAVVAVIRGKGETAAPAQPAPKAAPPPARAPSPAPAAAVTQHAIKPTIQMEPFREVRSPERNYGPARLPGGTVVTPLARRLAGEAGIDLTNIKGSGPHGRIVAADIETARKAPAPAPTQATTTIVLAAEIALDQSLALCADVKAIELADVIVRAWAMALARILPSEQPLIALAIGKDRTAIRGAESKSLTTIGAARRDTPGDMHGASTAISIPGVAGITSIADVLQPPLTTMLNLGAPRRAPIETADGSVKFVDMTTATLTCDHRVLDAAFGAELLAAFKGFVERPVTMIV
jgi:pyruvate dehydrogenase E2 component (dihydrolipoamide acetyltransferase)